MIVGELEGKVCDLLIPYSYHTCFFILYAAARSIR